ncbi:MAG TPA: phosphotransferase [Candidatus Dormibacteraeota bacterium]|jgi:aminoglycoside phosphotransferase
MESSSATLRLPSRVRAAAVAAVGGTRLDGELAWMSWAGTVWRLAGESGAVYVKRAADLTAERDRLAWLRGRLPVPEMVGFFHVVGDDWLVTRELPGVPLYHASVGFSPGRVARVLGEILRGIHSTDAADCPFGIRKRGHVLVHGDYCLPNVLVSQGKLSGLIDVGGTGLGDPRQDLAAGVWTLQYNFGKDFARDFLDAYGAPAMTDEEIERLRREYGR